jgi:hypothetical protein
VLLDALCGEPDPELTALLGAAAADELREALCSRARRWADAVARGRVWEVLTLDAAAAAVSDHDGAVLLAGWDVPRLSTRHADAALSDLRAGCVVSFAPATDGRPFLVALPGPAADAFALIPERYDNLPQAFTAIGGPIGLLPAERRLVTVADARALLADPLAPGELAGILRPGLGG